MISILIIVPVVSSSSFNDIFNDITGFFSKLVTGMAGAPTGGCPCTDGTLPFSCSNVQPWLYCYQTGDSCSLVQACEICGNCPESTPYCNLDDGIIGEGVCDADSSGDGICQDGESCSGESDCSGQTGDQADCSTNYFCDYGVCTSLVVCGNNIIEGSEICDGTSLNSQTCITQGFDSGTLTCAASCAGFTTTGCQNDVIINEIVEEDNSTDVTEEVSNCGNGRIDNDEECDGSNLGGWSCIELGLYSNSNSLECGNDCLLDLSSCVDEHEENIVNNVTSNTCGGIGGICMNGCIDGYESANNSNFNLECQEDFSISSLVCCVVSDEQDGSTSPEFSDISSELKESLEEKNEASQTGYFNSGITEVLTSPKAIGGIWIAFILSAFVVLISTYVHRRFMGRRNQKAYK